MVEEGMGEEREFYSQLVSTQNERDNDVCWVAAYHGSVDGSCIPQVYAQFCKHQ
jgi:hypothetical protein